VSVRDVSKGITVLPFIPRFSLCVWFALLCGRAECVLVLYSLMCMCVVQFKGNTYIFV